MNELIDELIDMRADSVSPGETVCLGGVTILVTGVDTASKTVDLHTEYGPALRLLRTDLIPVVVPASAIGLDEHAA